MNSQSSTIEYLIGMSFMKNGFDGIQKITSLLSNKDLIKTCQDELLKFSIENNTSYLKMEYLGAKNASSLIASGHYGFQDSAINKKAVNNKFYYKENKTTSYYADGFTTMIKNTEQNCVNNEIIKTENPLAFNSLWDFPKLYFTDNVIGKILYTMNSIGLSNVETKRCELKQKKSLTESILTKKLYELENKK